MPDSGAVRRVKTKKQRTGVDRRLPRHPPRRLLELRRDDGQLDVGFHHLALRVRVGRSDRTLHRPGAASARAQQHDGDSKRRAHGGSPARPPTPTPAEGL